MPTYILDFDAEEDDEGHATDNEGHAAEEDDEVHGGDGAGSPYHFLVI